MIHPSNFRSNFSSPSLTCILITFPIWTRREEKMKKTLFQLSLNVSFYESEENLSNCDRHTMCGSGSRRERFDIPRKNSQVRLSSGCCVMSVWRKIVGKSMFGEQNKMKNSRLWLCARERSLLNGDERPAVSYWDHRVYTTEKKQSTHEEENCEKSSAIIEAWRTAIVLWRAWYLPRCDDRGPPATGCWRDDVALEHQQQREKWKNSRTFLLLKYAIFVNNVYKIHVWSSHCASSRSWVFQHFPQHDRLALVCEDFHGKLVERKGERVNVLVAKTPTRSAPKLPINSNAHRRCSFS